MSTTAGPPSRIAETFARLRRENRAALIPYLMAGDPDLETTRRLVLSMARHGGDIIELGVPFSDPLADGPTIQAASQRALARGTTLTRVFALVRRLRRETQVPLVLMTYYNLIFRMGEEGFVRRAVAAGVDGVIVPDLPPEEAQGLLAPARRHGLDTVFLAAPTSTPQRLQKVAEASTGFVYYVSLTGVTGSRLTVDEALRRGVQRLRAMTDKPVAVGFGVSTPEQAARIARWADGVIVGSAIVRRIGEVCEKGRGLREVAAFVAALRRAMPRRAGTAKPPGAI